MKPSRNEPNKINLSEERNNWESLIEQLLKQMDYYESTEFYPAFSEEDRVRIYSVFGGIPYYNRFVSKSPVDLDGIEEAVEVISLTNLWN